jgi:hypothetical protein
VAADAKGLLRKRFGNLLEESSPYTERLEAVVAASTA